jgi:hypothetical protein
MKPIAWYDPTNGVVSTDKDSPLFTPLGQLWPLDVKLWPLDVKQEEKPVAWGVFEGNLHDMFFSQEEAQEMADLKGTHAEVRPLYTTPPQRTWVGLTYEEEGELIRLAHNHAGVRFYIQAAEAKLKEKNHG